MRNCNAPISNFSFDEAPQASHLSAVKVVPDGVTNVKARLENKLEMILKQFVILTLTLNKKTSDVEKFSEFCFHCQKEGHHFCQNRENQMRTALCGYCHKIGHIIDRCFQIRYVAPKARTQRNEKTDKESSGQHD